MGLPGDLVKALREELTSGDANTRKPLTDLALSAILKDSTGAELSDYVKSLGNLDVLLSSRASESTLSAIKAQTDKLTFDASGYLQVNAKAVANPPNLDVALSVIRDLFRPILKGSIFNSPVSANTNIFASDLAPTYTPTTFRIYACFNASGVLSIVRTKGGVTVTEQLNSGSALNANCAYAFDVIVEGGETINLRYSVAATALVLKVVEVPGAVS
jgi:hypothetical protein